MESVTLKVLSHIRRSTFFKLFPHVVNSYWFIGAWKEADEIPTYFLTSKTNRQTETTGFDSQLPRVKFLLHPYRHDSHSPLHIRIFNIQCIIHTLPVGGGASWSKRHELRPSPGFISLFTTQYSKICFSSLFILYPMPKWGRIVNRKNRRKGKIRTNVNVCSTCRFQCIRQRST